MITAREALALPSARLSDSDREAVERFLAEADAFVRANMGRIGCAMPINPLEVNEAIAVETCLRLKRCGYNAAFQKLGQPGAISNQPVVTGFFLTMQPTDDSYEMADASVPFSSASRPMNGVATP